MRVSYHDDYVIPLPPRHSFPMPKFSALRDIVVHEELVAPQNIIAPEEADWDLLGLVHTRNYLDSLRCGAMTMSAVRRMGFPWTPALVRRSRLAVQGTMNAAMMALEDGISGNLAGGTHHAMPDHAQGFCVLNDTAIAIRALQESGLIRRALVIDLDVHQGNGTAKIFEHDPSVYTFSVHGEKNFPLRKERSTRDVPLPDHMDDADYLRAIDMHLPSALNESEPDIVFYVQGVDIVSGDKFGRVNVSRQCLIERDTKVLSALKDRGLPLVLLLGGGYAATPHLTADLHAEMHRAARRVGYAANPSVPA
ncbi:MAG: histone deacetylase [Phycisphaerales bacterium JB065]